MYINEYIYTEYTYTFIYTYIYIYIYICIQICIIRSTEGACPAGRRGRLPTVGALEPEELIEAYCTSRPSWYREIPEKAFRELVYTRQYLVPNTWYDLLGTIDLVPSTWYDVLGTKCLVPNTWYFIPSDWYRQGSVKRIKVTATRGRQGTMV